MNVAKMVCNVVVYINHILSIELKQNAEKSWSLPVWYSQCWKTREKGNIYLKHVYLFLTVLLHSDAYDYGLSVASNSSCIKQNTFYNVFLSSSVSLHLDIWSLEALMMSHRNITGKDKQSSAKI